MDFFTIKPPPALAGVVNFFWVSRCMNTEEEIFNYYSIAETYSKMVFMYRISSGDSVSEDDEYYSALQGQTNTHERFPTPGSFEIFGVSLLPGAVPRLFGFSAPEINNRTLDLPLLFGRRGKELDEKMAVAADTRERIAIITGFLERRLFRNNREETVITSAIREIHIKRGAVDIAALARSHYLSQKHFKRKFVEESGFTPKLFARIVRFETAVARYPAFRSFTEMSHACGYYDQSHFIRDFREFSGYTPKQYFELAESQLP